MKKSFYIFLIMCITGLVHLKAQDPIAVLVHGQQTTAYYGNNALVDAHTAAANGDTINLSSGTFNSVTITKSLNITGVGHYPDSVNMYLRTIVSGITFGQYSDSSKIEGLYIPGNIEFTNDKHIIKVKVNRCNMQDFNFNSNAQIASKDYCSITQSIIRGNVNCSNYCTSFMLSNCILNGMVLDVSGTGSSCSMENNIFLAINQSNTATYLFYNINNSSLHNNVIYQNDDYVNPYYSGAHSHIFYHNCNNLHIVNNIFLDNGFDYGNSYSINNYLGVVQTAIFVNQTGNVFNYNHNYHLQSPATYPGLDGSQAGIYGGDKPYKENAIPSNPHVQSKNIPFKTDNNGNLLININVKAQDN